MAKFDKQHEEMPSEQLEEDSQPKQIEDEKTAPWQKLSKNQTEAEQVESIEPKRKKLKKKNVKGYVGPGGGPAFQGPSAAPDKQVPHPSRKLK